MKKHYVPRDQCIELYKLGFNEPCLAWWWKKGELSVPTRTTGMFEDWNNYPSKKRISAAFWQQAFDYFVEIHKLNALIYYNFNGTWNYQIQKVEAGLLSGQITDYVVAFDTPEKARVAALKTLIELVKESNHVLDTLKK